MITKDWKYYVGMTFLSLSILFPFLGFALPFLDLPLAWKTLLVGAFTLGVPEVMIAIAVIFLGKETLAYYKKKFFKLFKRTKPRKPVTKGRYYFGVALFLGSIIPLYLNAYRPTLLPSSDRARQMIFISCDLLFILSFFILGGNFWEKLRRLFIWDPPEKSK